MNKEEFVLLLKEFKRDASLLIRDCKRMPKQVQSKDFLMRLEEFCIKWTNDIEPLLKAAQFPLELIQKYSAFILSLLKSSTSRPLKRSVLVPLGEFVKKFNDEIIIRAQTQPVFFKKFDGLENLLSSAIGLEVDYLKEAIDCAQLGKKRAAVILGWCAAVNRMQLFVEKNGFPKFNDASAKMQAIQTGRYKRFNKKFEIHNMTELRMNIFDGDLLWVLEFLDVIDGNQHERLEICFTMRNNCAHPGDAGVSDENLVSFFSDLNSMVLSNPKFKLVEVA